MKKGNENEKIHETIEHHHNWDVVAARLIGHGAAANHGIVANDADAKSGHNVSFAISAPERAKR